MRPIYMWITFVAWSHTKGVTWVCVLLGHAQTVWLQVTYVTFGLKGLRSSHICDFKSHTEDATWVQVTHVTWSHISSSHICDLKSHMFKSHMWLEVTYLQVTYVTWSHIFKSHMWLEVTYLQVTYVTWSHISSSHICDLKSHMWLEVTYVQVTHLTWSHMFKSHMWLEVTYVTWSHICDLVAHTGCDSVSCVIWSYMYVRRLRHFSGVSRRTMMPFMPSLTILMSYGVTQFAFKLSETNYACLIPDLKLTTPASYLIWN